MFGILASVSYTAILVVIKGGCPETTEIVSHFYYLGHPTKSLWPVFSQKNEWN